MYCFARPTHEFLGLGLGEDFERVLVVKVNAVERLEAELRPGRWDASPTGPLEDFPSSRQPAPTESWGKLE